MSTPIGCLFSNTSLYVWSSTQLIGWVLPIFISLFARYRDPSTQRWVSECFLILYGYYLWLALGILYIAQIALGQMQPDPFCPYQQNYSFPALAPFYIGSAIGLTLFIPVFLNSYYSWFTGVTILCCIWIVPPTVLIWYSIFTPTQVGMSLGIGVATTLIFILMYRFWWMPVMPYVVNTPLFRFLSVSETWFSTTEQQRDTARIARCVEEQERGKPWLC